MSVKIFKIFISELNKTFLTVRPILTHSQRLASRYVSTIDPLPTRYGGKTNVTVLPGVGIGPEITQSALEVLQIAGAPLSFEVLPLSDAEAESADWQNALTSIRRNKVALKGNIELKSKNPYDHSRNILLRKTLDLYVYLLNCKTFPGLENKFGEIDVTVIRQNTEGEYLMLEHEPVRGSVESLKIVTKFNSERIAEFAFNYALAHKRKHITVVHNAHVQPLAEGMFIDAAKKVSRKYPTISLQIKDVRVAVFQLSKNPKAFDVILATNLNGSIVSNFLNGMCGGPGLSSGINFSENGIAVFEPGARNKGSSIVGQGIANPVAMMLSGINLLEYLGYNKTADMVRNSVFATLVYDRVHTQDLGGTATTKEITDGVISHIRKQLVPKRRKKEDHMLHHKWKSYCPPPPRQPPQKKP